MGLETRLITAFATLLVFGQTVFGGYAALQLLSAFFSISRKNAQKKTEGIDHLGWVAACIIGVALIQLIVSWLKAI